MKKYVILFGATFLIPLAAVGQSSFDPSASPRQLKLTVASLGIFDQFFDAAAPAVRTAYPSQLTTAFVLQEMLRWNGDGIKLTEEDLRAAVDGDLPTLCSGHADASGRAIILAMGADSSVGGSCLSLQTAVLSLLDADQEAIQLSQNLHSIAYGSELAISDEIQHHLNLGRHVQLLKRIWSNTGAGILPWDPALNPELDALAAALRSEGSSMTQDRVVLRFRHGYFREKREGSPFADVGDSAGEVLARLAEALEITGDEEALGEYQSQPLPGLTNVVLWARKDDLGITWEYPIAFPYRERLPDDSLKRDGTYPVIAPGSERTAYPFLQLPPETQSIASPLCARTTGRKGYLCRPVPGQEHICEDTPEPADQRITLAKCSEETNTTVSGPDVCKDLEVLFKNETGKPLTDPKNPGQLNPDLTPADLETICSPGNTALYQHELLSHACYIGACLEQSMETHALVPGRNPTLVNESTSPWLACIRDDPKLAVAVEVARNTPYPLPPYVGHELVRDFEQVYCLQAARAPYGVLGLCSFRDEERAARPDTTPLFQTQRTVGESSDIRVTQESFLALATSVGQRKAMDQSVEVERRVFVSLAEFVRQVADLFLELKAAPLTDVACPWTGPFPRSSSTPSQ